MSALSLQARILRRLSVCLAALCLASALGPLGARAQTSTADLAVHVVDPDGESLPGVTVRVANVDTGLSRESITDAGGGVLFSLLPPGTYEVGVRLEGMIAPAPEVTRLLVGQRARMSITLRPQVVEAITVTGEVPLVDVHRMDSSTNVTTEQIESLPVADRQFEKLAFLAPGVQRDRTRFFDRTGAPVIGSSGNSAVATVLVDGLDFADPFTGQARLRLSQDSIQEFRVIGQGFDAEVGGTSGGGLSVVTKSGTNTVRSSAYVFLRDKALRAKGELELEEADYSRYHVGFTLGGPLTRDRTHYFTAFEHVDEDDIALVRPGGAFVDLAADVVAPREQTTALLGLDHSFGTSMSGVAKLYWERYRRGNYDIGGVIDESHGWGWNRDVWTLLGGHTWVLGATHLNELRMQLVDRDGGFPANSEDMGEWFTFGSTLQTGGNWVGPDNPLEGNTVGLRNTYHWQPGAGRHQLKAGLEYQHIENSYAENRLLSGLMVYWTDDRADTYAYLHLGDGSTPSNFDTDLYGLFVHDSWQVRDNLTLALGLRYDVDTNGNLPNFKHPLVPNGRDVDYDNLQPRLGFTWDVMRDGRTVVRGGIGRFVGRYNGYATHYMLLYNDTIGREILTRVSDPEYGLLDPEDPENSGRGLPPDIALYAERYRLPEATQARLGVSQQIGSRSLFFDAEAVYAEGRDEAVLRNTNWAGNDDPGWIHADYTTIETGTDEGYSRYGALSASLRGTLWGRHLITAGLIVAEKKNITDDAGTGDMPSDSADVSGEWGRSGTNEPYRLVMSGAFRLPWKMTLSAVYEYGAGQPWNRVYGYDFNGDFSLRDRPDGVARNDRDGPRFSQFDLLLSKTFALGGQQQLELSFEVFNLLNTTNYAVTSVDDAMYFAGPTLKDPTIPFFPNPGFGEYRDTHRPREAQIGLRWRM